MLLIVAREPLPDKAYWPGRTILAVIDAIAWPLAFSIWTMGSTVSMGIVGPTAVSVAALVALVRVRRALFSNHRYYFITWRVAKVAGTLLSIGLVMKMLMVR